MKIQILTLFPDACEGILSQGILGRARRCRSIEIQALDLRRWAVGKHRVTDEAPYGGGPGMVMKIEPYASALADLCRPHTRTVLMSAQGRRFQHAIAYEYSLEKEIILLCGHYEGVDQRVADHLVDDAISIGDYVLTSGVLPALVFVDTVVRLIPGVLGNADSAGQESFIAGLLDYPSYTRPEMFQGWRVPPVLLSGDHAEIRKWRAVTALELTRQRRPDLLGLPLGMAGKEAGKECPLG
ncbi:MAG: tRNA (guanosine(37)-N1)-methyltransferase TrmD [Candidatus Xiphinematobacter sp.]|nr:MAG: tRNA (guanosine(37)-N1)-methyltransferase TrmD [Candidatus Xiphinematobacter sp.]